MRQFQVARRLIILTKRESGSAFIETVVALAILGVISVSFLSGLASASRSTVIADEQSTAESLVRSQMEWIKSADYVYGATGYTPAPIPGSRDYLNYSVVITAELLNNPDDGIQKITVTIKHGDKGVIKLEGYKRQG